MQFIVRRGVVEGQSSRGAAELYSKSPTALTRPDRGQYDPVSTTWLPSGACRNIKMIKSNQVALREEIAELEARL
jgi:hypothetical protein